MSELKKNKILITGSSGFIGTNIMNFYLQKTEYDVLGIDIVAPRVQKHTGYFKKTDILEYDNLENTILEYEPDFIIHLAATTDINEKDGLQHYSANIEGVKNMMLACNECNSLQRLIIASSMLVNRAGYYPKNFNDYNPTTLYGKSKVKTEQIVKSFESPKFEWILMRLTSIWGEWFKEPYRNFFDMVLGKKFFHPSNKACTKTYGYVGNVTFQIDKLLFADSTLVHKKTFYIGDKPAINISNWANLICEKANMKKPITVTFFVFKILALTGDFLKLFNIKFPMTSFRLNNMTTDNIINLDSLDDIVGKTPYSIEDGVERTLKWLR